MKVPDSFAATKAYFAFCITAIALWLIVWLLAFHNLYGWLIDDHDTFSRVMTYEQGGSNLLNIQWFHAYMWFLATVPWLLHASVPSSVAAREFTLTPIFRAMILYTIVLHAIILGLVSWLLRQLCANLVVDAAAFLLFITSPTLAFYTPLLDSRYLGLLAALPAIVLLLKDARRLDGVAPSSLLWRSLTAGFLFAMAEDIHYECLYLTVPFCIVYWTLRLAERTRWRFTLRELTSFLAGVVVWVIPLQLLSLLYRPSYLSYIGMMLLQRTTHLSPYSWLSDLRVWPQLFISEMGWPMMVAVIVGGVMLAHDRIRPPYVDRFSASVIVGSATCLAIYILFSRTFPFYRMVADMQIFYALMATVAIERICSWLLPRLSIARCALALILLVLISIVPTGLRTPEVFAAQQGYGRAINFAYHLSGTGTVRFIDTFDDEAEQPAVITRRQFFAMRQSDYLVTYFPVVFHFKYPDLFALLYDVRPVASYPTLWCTKAMWAEIPTFFGGRRWYDEPPSCEAQVFRVADIRREESRPQLVITSVSADSSAPPAAIRFPYFGRIISGRIPGSEPVDALLPRTGRSWIHDQQTFWHPDAQELWVSRPASDRHWLQIDFASPTIISAVTIVPPEFRVPPDFLWAGRMRIGELRIFGWTPGTGPAKLLWSRQHLEHRVIFTATFPPARVSHLRLVILQAGSPSANRAAGITFVRFPGYHQVLRLFSKSNSR